MKFLNVFFVSLGVVFFLLIIAGTTVYVSFTKSGAPLLNSIDAVGVSIEENTKAAATNPSRVSSTTDSHPLLSEGQEKALKTFGIDPATLPTSISPAQEQCFIEKLGAEKVVAIKNGAAPSAADLFMARDCVQI